MYRRSKGDSIYRSRNKSRRRTYSNRSYFRRRKNPYYPLKKKVNRIARKVDSMEDQKSAQMSITWTAQAEGSTVASYMFNIIQGTEETNRLGNEIRIDSITFQGQCTPSSTTPNNCTIRILCVQDKRPNGANPAWSDMFASVPTATHRPWDLINVAKDEVGRFNILWQGFFNVGTRSEGTANFKGFLKPRGLKVGYKGTANDITDMAKNNIVWMVCQYGADTNLPDINLQCRFRFRDA